MAGQRRPLIAGNWKMNGSRAEARALLAALIAGLRGRSGGPEVLVCPPATLLSEAAAQLAGSGIGLGAQDCHTAAAGAHTGDIAAPMLADAGCRYVILGHSERRTDHGETSALVRAKAEAARAASLTPIICIGETLDEREAGRTLDVIGGQLADSLPAGLAGDAVVIAYEPVWAIGTGRTPTLPQVGEVHAFLRGALAGKVSEPAAVRLLYGGSVKAGNARELLAVADVDGALVGGASLKADEFLAIIAACPSQ